MDPLRHRTLKRSPATATSAATASASQASTQAYPMSRAEYAALAEERFATLLRSGAEEAYMRPWHRIERGLRLNRLRIFVEEISPQFDMSKEEKEDLFTVLQKAHDRKLLNTLKVVQYDQEKQRILSIRGLELKRTADGILKGSIGIAMKDTTASGTRKKKKEEPIVRVMTATTPAASAAAAAADDLNEKKES